MTAYKTGSKKQVLQNLVMCAIRDQEALLDACIGQSGQVLDADTIKDCREWIADFKRLGKVLENTL